MALPGNKVVPCLPSCWKPCKRISKTNPSRVCYRTHRKAIRLLVTTRSSPSARNRHVLLGSARTITRACAKVWAVNRYIRTGRLNSRSLGIICVRDLTAGNKSSFKRKKAGRALGVVSNC